MSITIKDIINPIVILPESPKKNLFFLKIPKLNKSKIEKIKINVEKK